MESYNLIIAIISSFLLFALSSALVTAQDVGGTPDGVDFGDSSTDSSFTENDFGDVGSGPSSGSSFTENDFGDVGSGLGGGVSYGESDFGDIGGTPEGVDFGEEDFGDIGDSPEGVNFGEIQECNPGSGRWGGSFGSCQDAILICNDQGQWELIQCRDHVSDDDDDDDDTSGPSGAPTPGQPTVIINDPPTITSTPVTSATEDTLYTYDVDATDPDGDSLTFSLPQGPSGMTLSTSTGLIQWTPTNNQVGNINVKVQVQDPSGLSATQQFTISVTAVNDAPILQIPDQTINEDAGFVDNLVDLLSFAFDEETSLVNLIFSVITQSNTNVVDCSLDSNRFIDCTTKQDQNGFSDVNVRVQDESSLSTDNTFRVNVGNINDAPSVQILEPHSTFLENQEFDIIAQATDIDFDALTYTIDFGDGTTETGNVVNNLIQTKHSYPSQGTFTLSITVTDGISSDTDTVIITVQPFTVKIVADKERNKFPLKVNFDANINGGKEPYTFEWDFNGDGIIDSTQRKPTVVFKNKGTFSVLLKVTDSDGDVSTDTVSIKVIKIESMPRKIAHINSINFENEFVEAGDNLDIFVSFDNNGNININNARLTAIIQDLGIRSRTVKAVVGKNKEASKFLTLEIPDYAQPGIYYVEIVIDLDGDRRIKYRPIEII